MRTSLPALAALLPLQGMRGQANVALEELVLENGWPATIVGELKLAELETAPLIPDGSGSLAAARRLHDHVPCRRPTGAFAAQFVDNGGPLEVSGSCQLDARAPTRSTRSSSRAPVRPRRSSTGLKS